MRAETLNRIGTWMAGVTIAMAAFDVMEANVDIAAKPVPIAAVESVATRTAAPGPAEIAALSGAPVATTDPGARLRQRAEIDAEDSLPLVQPSTVRLAEYTFD